MLKTNKQTPIILLFGILVLTIFIYIFFLRMGHDWGGDFAEYIGQTKSLVEGFRFSENQVFGYAPTWCWGFPILLIPVYYLFGLNIFIMKLLVNSFFFAGLIVIFFLFKNKIRYPLILMIVAIIAFNPFFFLFKDNVLSDIPYFFFALFSIFLIQRFIVEEEFWINQYFSYCLLGVSIFFSYFIRSQGLVLIPLLLLTFIYTKRKEILNNNKDLFNNGLKFFKTNILHIIPYGVFLGLLLITNNTLPNGGTSNYLTFVSQISFNSISSNIASNVIMMANFFDYYSAFGIFKYHFIIFLFTLPFVIYGTIKSYKKYYLFVYFIVISMLFFIIWPMPTRFRYWFSIVPFYLFFFFIGLQSLNNLQVFKKLPWKEVGTKFAYTFSVLIILTSILVITQQGIVFKNEVIEGPYTDDSVEMFHYVINNTSKNDLVIFMKPAVMRLYADRNSTHLIDRDADYFVYMNALKNEPEQVKILKSPTQNFTQVFSNAGFVVYKITTS